MKTTTLTTVLLSLLFVWGCGQKNQHDEGNHSMDTTQNNANIALYDEVMKIHNEVMPKMDDLYKRKEELKAKVATPGVVEEKKKEIDATILKLDSASESMMAWMHEFKPLPDSLGNEKVREYLETEMEKIKNVRTGIQEALEKAGTLLQ